MNKSLRTLKEAENDTMSLSSTDFSDLLKRKDSDLGATDNGIVLFYHPASSKCRAIWWYCLEYNVKLILEEVNIFAKENLIPEFEGLNPNQSVPVMVHADFILYETVAILRYLALRYSASDPTEEPSPMNNAQNYPSDLKTRAIINYTLSIIQSKLAPLIDDLMSYKCWFYLSEKATPGNNNNSNNNSGAAAFNPKDAEAIERLENKLHAVLATLNNNLSEHTFIATNEKSIADYLCYEELTSLSPIQFDFSKYEKLKNWMKTMKASTNYEEVHSFYEKEFVPCIIKELGKLNG